MRGTRKFCIVVFGIALISQSFLSGLFFDLQKANASVSTYFVDNTVVGGNNDGSNWPNAFRSIADLEDVVVDNESYYTIYIKASGTPYREYLNLIHGHITIYGDATGGTGAETTRGTEKAEFWASVDTTSFTWMQEGASNVFRSEGVDLYDSVHGWVPFSNATATTTAVAWYYSSATPTIPTIITAFANSGVCPGTITDLTLNKACYNYTDKKVWVNIGINPAEKHIEIVKIDRPIEINTNEQLYGVVAKHGKYGMKNDGCYNWIIEKSEILYNDFGTNANASDLNTSSYFRKNSIHNNQSGGVYIMASIVRNVHYQNNLIYSNGNSTTKYGGMYLRSANSSTDPGEMGYIENNTIYENYDYGIYIKNNGFTDYENWTVKNNIVIGNTVAQLYLFNAVDELLIASNNAPGDANPYGGIWAANKGTGNVETDPLMVSPTSPTFDFRLKSDSPAINAGVDVSITSDYLGTAVPQGVTPDIGAYEYDATAPVLSGGSSIGATNNNTPNFTFTSDEAGTISYTGDCSSSSTVAAVGSNTVAFNTLADGTHSNCKVTVTDPAGNISNQLQTASFSIDVASPTISITQPLLASTTDSSVVIEGSTADTDSGVASLTINGVTILNPTSFSATANLNIGSNTFTIIATDNAGNSTTKTLTITRTSPVSAAGEENSSTISSIISSGSHALAATATVTDNSANPEAISVVEPIETEEKSSVSEPILTTEEGVNYLLRIVLVLSAIFLLLVGIKVWKLKKKEYRF